jgi:nitrogen fixation regulatory protein
MNSVIDELTPDLLGKSDSLSNDGMPYGLFVEAVEQVPIAISITDKKAKILYINEEFCKVTGYQPEDILGENESILSDKCTPRSVYSDLWKTISRKKTWRGRLINRHKKGTRYLTELTIAPILDKKGAVTHYIGMHRNITTAYEAERKAANQRLLIESVINSSPNAIVLLDEQDRVVLDNDPYKALVSDLGKGEPAAYFLKLLRDEMGDLWQHLEATQQHFINREFQVETKGRLGTLWFSCAGNWFIEKEVNVDAFFEDNSKQYLLLTLTDITRQRKQMEELHLQALKIMITEDERIRSIRETLLGAMHQIRMPMNQIMAAEQILLHKRDEKNAGLIDILQQIQKSGDEAVATMQNCIPEIFLSAVIPVNLNRILHEVMLLSEQRLLKHDIKIHWLPQANLPAILGSENRLRILFKQLIDNAIDAMSQSACPDPQIKIITETDGDLIIVFIEDTGPGIPLDKRVKVFEPFYTTRSMGGNQAGMGLVMVKEIVNQHQGVIDISSDYDKGCCFKISFPKHKSTG